MERRAITIEGIVQGVGFRPFVCKLAADLGLSGFVRNQAGVVEIEIEGESLAIEKFISDVRKRPPPLAQIQQITCKPSAPNAQPGFVIAPSTADAKVSIFISPD